MVTDMKRNFFVTGYVGEGAERMLSDLHGMDNVTLISKVIGNRGVRFLYYRLNQLTHQFQKGQFLKKLFYSWFSILNIPNKDDVENCIIFINSGFCKELDITVVNKLKSKYKSLKLVLYLVDPMVGFCEPKYMDIIKEMDFVYSINKEDCNKYGFHYYPLVYSRAQVLGEVKQESLESDLYYLGSGVDRTQQLQKIYERCKSCGIRTDFHVLSDDLQEYEGITSHQKPVPYAYNMEHIMQTNCILEVMHEDFDNPTQRYSEAVAYNKKLLTNNRKTAEFDFYDPRFMQIFDSIEEIDMDFIKDGNFAKDKSEVDYKYKEEFSPRLLIEDITARLADAKVATGGKA